MDNCFPSNQLGRWRGKKKGNLNLQSNALFCIIIHIIVILHIILDKHKRYLMSLKITTMNNTGGLCASVWGVQLQSLDSPGNADYPLWKARSPVRAVPFLTQKWFFMEKELVTTLIMWDAKHTLSMYVSCLRWWKSGSHPVLLWTPSAAFAGLRLTRATETSKGPA